MSIDAGGDEFPEGETDFEEESNDEYDETQSVVGETYRIDDEDEEDEEDDIWEIDYDAFYGDVGN